MIKGKQHIIEFFLRTFLAIAIGLFFSFSSHAQPVNDNCSNANTITITGGGFDKGVFTGTQVDMSASTSQTAEYFAPSIVVSGLNKKSVWYKFSLPTHRSVRVSIGQPGSAIQAGNVGFAVYKTNTCLPGDKDLSKKLSPIETFGNTYHPCVDPGEYLVQVSGSNGANGPILLSVEIGESDPAPFDKLTNASNFGLLSNKSYSTDFFVECQSIDEAAEVCQTSPNFNAYTKSTWHTFKTPAYFDYLNVWMGYIGGGDGTNISKYGYRIFEGDPSSGLNALKQVGSCDSLTTNIYAIGKKGYKCDALKPNTTYTVQLLYHKDFKGNVRFMVDWNGTSPTNAPIPVSSISSPNNMGTLNAGSSFWGETNSASDVFACNAKHDKNDCTTLPKTGLNYQGKNYNLSSFFTFKLATTSTAYFGLEYSCSNVLIRLYKKKLTADCKQLDSTSLISTFIPNFNAYNYSPLQCLDSGDYVVQVMGSDEENDFNYVYWNACTYNNLGTSFKLNINVRSEIDINKFSLSSAGKFDKINADASGVMQPLKPGTYTATPDTFGCANTVIPDSTNCGILPKASYREFVVADSMIMMDHVSSNYYWRVYKADANALAIAQGSFSYPKKLKDMTPYTYCATGYYNNSYESGVCLVPGTYTIVSLDDRVSQPSTMEFKIVQPKAKYNAPEKAEDLGDILAKIKAAGGGWYRSDLDTFSCQDNPRTIDGVAPCTRGTLTASKLIYRQFYLSKPTTMSFIAGDGGSLQPRSSGVFSLFKGKATDGVDKLKAYGGRWTCSAYMYPESQCDQLPEGWYTIVEYGWGSTYNTLYKDGYGQDLLAGSSVGKTSVIYFNAQPDCQPQQFNRASKASIDTSTKKPYLIEWANGTEHTDAYPQTSKRYVLNTEYFNCSNDTDYIRKNLSMCTTSMTDHGKVAFYVFKTTQESYLNIQNIPNGLWTMVYDFDARGADSVKLKTGTPIQSCNANGESIEFCKLQPGTYTLVFYVPLNSYTCATITPWIYIDKIGYSRFDHAINAYDFGSVKPDSTWKKGKDGDINPLDANRSPSNDFFYCTTGAQENDPAAAACMTFYNPLIYSTGNNIVLHPDKNQYTYNTIDRRNLWYTFKADHPGTIRVRVENKTPGKNGYYQQVPFAVYKSDVDGTLPFDQVVANGQVDSTQLQGLSLVRTNIYYYYCYGSQEIEFYVEPCSFKPTRYYIVADNRNMYGWDIVKGMNPNHQIEVSVLLDSVNSRPPKFDHYSQAHDMGLINSGRKKGETDNYTCATRDLPDPIYAYTNCEKTLWYKFTTTTSGTIRYAAFFRGQYQYYFDNIQLFRQIKPNDSSSNGLQHLPYTSTYYENGNWAQQCISPGTYYILLPGCNAVNEDVFPEIEIIQQQGDFCSNPMIAELNGASSATASTVIDCHTIGTDYGEFNKNLTCPANALTADYKSTWYRLDIKGKDTVDVTVFIGNRTNVDNTKVKYRMMTGNCGAMQEQSCVQDALTRNTYKCLAPGNSYYIQVFTPITVNGYYQTTGSIDLNVNAVIHADTCLPADPCIAVANFTPEFDCTKDKEVRFTNFSTYGSDIQYSWDFGYGNGKSNAVSPSFYYPALTADSTYKIKLIVKNIACGKVDSVTQSITIPARPTVDLGRDTIFCKTGSSISFDATSFSGTTYLWNNGSSQATYTANYTAKHYVELTYKGCKARDTVDVWINPISKKAEQFLALCNATQVTLNASRGYGEQFKWSTNQSASSITVSQPGIYWADVYLNTCIIRDTFRVVSTDLTPLGNDTTVCLKNLPIKLDASVSGASGYRWSDNSTNATINASKAGLYWVDITLGGCVFRDSVTVFVDTIVQKSLTANICLGQQYELPSGKFISIAGTYKDTLYNTRGCDSLVSTITLSVTDAKRRTIDTTICFGNSFSLPSGRVVSVAGNYQDTLYSVGGCLDQITTLRLKVDQAQSVTVDVTICENATYTSPSGKQWSSVGTYLDTLRNKRGCDSIQYSITIKILPIYKKDTSVTICNGIAYKLPGGRLVTLSGEYRDTLKTQRLGCDSIINTTLTVLPKLSVSLNQPNAVCEGTSVTLTAVASGGNSGPYIYSWSNTSSSGNSIIVTPSATTKYTVTVTDGCTLESAVDSVTVVVNPFPDATITASTLSACYKAGITFSSSANVARYKWDWGTGVAKDTANSKSSSFVYPAAGTYNVTLSLFPITGCNISKSQSVTILERPVADITGTWVVCAKDSVQFKGVADKYPITKWLWSFGNGSTALVQDPTKQVYGNAGNYSVSLIIENNSGCRDTLTKSIKVNALPVIGLNGVERQLCLGSSTRLDAKGGGTYSWSPSTDLSNVSIASPDAAPKADIVYGVKVTSTDGCISNDSIKIKVTQPFTLTATADTFVCVGGSVQLSAAGAEKYLWSGNGLSSNASSVTVKPAATSTYSIKGTGLYDCFSFSKDIIVKVIPYPVVNAGNDTTIMVGTVIQLQPYYSNDVSRYSWSPSTFLSCLTCPNPFASPEQPIEYTVTATNAYNCSTSDSRKISLLCNAESVFLPNTFTPNGDGMNDVLYPRGEGIKQVKHLRIFNRWGQVVFERLNFNTNDRSAAWDGTFKGQLLPPDVFVFTMSVICDNNQVVETKGNVMIVR